MLKNWKLKLRYGKLTTEYKHYTVLAQVRIDQYIEDFNAQPGKAWAGIKLWAKNTDDAGDMIASIGEQVGFTIIGNIEVYSTDAIQPPGDEPYAYDINFSYYKD